MKITSLNQLDKNAKYSYADYLKWDLEEYIELFDGKISILETPYVIHQQIKQNLGIIFLQYRKVKNDKYPFFMNPVDVKLFNDNNVEDKRIFTSVLPDIWISFDKSKLDIRGHGFNGAPDLIIEILSKSTSKKDYNDKYNLYEEAGVKEYWIVSPSEKFVSVYDLINDKYELRNHYEEGSVPVGIFENFEIAVEDIFAE